MGLAAAIRLKPRDEVLSIAVVEKGAEVGAHILSGAVIDPKGLDRLVPDWRDDPDPPLVTPVTGQSMAACETRTARAAAATSSEGPV